MLTTQVYLLAAIIVFMLSWAASLSLRLKDAKGSASDAKVKRGYYQSLLERQRQDANNKLHNVEGQLIAMQADLTEARLALKGAKRLQCLTFTNRVNGLRRFKVGGKVERLAFTETTDRLTVTETFTDSSKTVTHYKMSNITDAIVATYRD